MKTIIFLLLFALPLAARAQGTSAEKQKLAAAKYKDGRAHMEAKQYDAAIADFEAANAILPKPLLLYHLAEAYRLKGETARALQLYKDYLAAEPNGKPSADARSHVETLTGQVEREAAEAKEREAREAEAREAEAKDTDGDGIPDHRDRCPTVAAPGTTDGCPPEPGPRTRRWLALGVAGAGVAALAVSGIFGLQASSKWSDAQKTCVPGACDLAGHDSAVAARDAATISTIAFGVGVAAVATGIVLYVTSPRAVPERQARVTPSIGPGSFGLTLSGGF